MEIAIAVVAIVVGIVLGAGFEGDIVVADCTKLEKVIIHGKVFECREIKNDHQ